jgi:hypothetical protein
VQSPYVASTRYEKTITVEPYGEITLTFRRPGMDDIASVRDLQRVMEGEYGRTEYNFSMGSAQKLMVQRLLMGWSLPFEMPTIDSIGGLDPELFDAIYEAMELRRAGQEDEVPPSSQNGSDVIVLDESSARQKKRSRSIGPADEAS